MADIVTIRQTGNNLHANYDDDSAQLFAPTTSGFWIPLGGPVDTDVGDDGGDGNSDDDDTDPTPTPPPPDPPDPVTPSTGVDLYNPFKSSAISQSWESHIATAGRGGIDFPYAYGTAIKAPANGTLHISGGSGEYAAGQVGSAGRRSILYLDKKFARKKPRGSREAAGPMVAIVFQHQSVFGRAKHYNRGDIIGYTGASANGADYGGDVHLHVHGLDKAGARLDFLKFFA